MNARKVFLMYQFVFKDPIPPEYLKSVQGKEITDQVQIKNPSKSLTDKEFIELARGADAVFSLGNKFTEEMMEEMGAGEKNSPIKAVATVSVGFDHLPLQYLSNHKIALINTPKGVRYSTAELAVALTLALIRQIPLQDRKIRERGSISIPSFESFGTNLLGKTVGIMGMGNIGSKVAEVFHVLGANILYHQRHKASDDILAKTEARMVSKDELFSQSDIISLHVPFIPEFYHLIDEDRIAQMKDGVYIINTGRGKLIDEGALVRALKSGKVAGAALDVFENEPKVHPGLLELDNVVLSSHMGTSTTEAKTLMFQESVKGTLAFLNGEKPENLVNRKIFE